MLFTRVERFLLRYTPIFIVAVTVYGEQAANQIMAQVDSHAGIRILEKEHWYVVMFCYVGEGPPSRYNPF